MKRNLLKMGALALAATFLLTACSGSSGSSAPAPQGGGSGAAAGAVKNPNIDDGKNIVGICWSSLAAEATQVLVQNYQDHYKEYGIDELILLQAEGNLERQIDQLQDLANQNCDLIICNSVDPDGIAPVVENIMAQGIPVIAVDRRISADIYFTLETDNVCCGRDVARSIAMMTMTDADGNPAAEGSVEVLKCVGNMTSSAVRDRMSGLNDELAYWPHLKVVGEPSVESNIEKVYNAVLDGFKTNPNIKAIFVVGDNQVAPVVSALKELNMLFPPEDPRHVIIASVDGISSVVKGIQAGENDIVANQRFDLFASDVLKVCQDYFNGDTSVAGQNNKLPTMIVTRHNVDSPEGESAVGASSRIIERQSVQSPDRGRRRHPPPAPGMGESCCADSTKEVSAWKELPPSRPGGFRFPVIG